MEAVAEYQGPLRGEVVEVADIGYRFEGGGQRRMAGGDLGEELVVGHTVVQCELIVGIAGEGLPVDRPPLSAVSMLDRAEEAVRADA